MIGDVLRALRIEIDAFGEFPLRQPFRDQLEAFLAAHALLQIVPTLFEGVCDDREQRVVQLREELVAGADEYFHLIGLGSRLVEALAQIMQIERDEIDHRASGDAQNLSFLTTNDLPEFFGTTTLSKTAIGPPVYSHACQAERFFHRAMKLSNCRLAKEFPFYYGD